MSPPQPGKDKGASTPAAAPAPVAAAPVAAAPEAAPEAATAGATTAATTTPNSAGEAEKAPPAAQTEGTSKVDYHVKLAIFTIFALFFATSKRR